ncbi:MAG: type II toxin-antitoxin system YafQ family toxin [Patescibacteria group bacterium]
MYKILRSKSFRKSVKKIEKSGNKNNFRKLENIIDELSLDTLLNSKYRNHPLSGDMSDYRECHVGSDLLLIYKRDIKNKVIFLLDIGNHNDLFK